MPRFLSCCAFSSICNPVFRCCVWCLCFFLSFIFVHSSGGFKDAVFSAEKRIYVHFAIRWYTNLTTIVFKQAQKSPTSPWYFAVVHAKWASRWSIATCAVCGNWLRWKISRIHPWRLQEDARSFFFEEGKLQHTKRQQESSFKKTSWFWCVWCYIPKQLDLRLKLMLMLTGHLTSCFEFVFDV